MTQVIAKEGNISKENKSPFIHQLKSFLNSKWALLSIAVFVSVLWVLDVPIISISFLTIFVCLVLTICRDNPKAFLLPFLTLLYCFKSLPSTWQVIYCLVCALIVIGFIIYFIIWQLKVKGKKCTKGKMFWSFLILAVANIFGGLIGHFNILISLVVLGCFILLYFIYWFYLNFTHNCQKYFAWCAIFLSLTIILEIFFSHLASGNFIQSIINKAGSAGVCEGDSSCVGNINAASIVALIGPCACFYLALKNKKDYLYLLMALGIDLCIFFSYSRIATFVCAIVSIICLIYIIIKSPNRKALIIAVSCVMIIFLIFIAIFWSKVLNAINYYLNMGFKLNGRATLWNWCLNQFKNSFIFGIGFVTNEPSAAAGEIPGCSVVIYEKLAMVYAHNFFLHFLLTVGIVGVLCAIPFYIQKYKLIFKKFTTFKLYIIVTCLALFSTSLVDPTYTSNLFLICFVLLLVSSAEKITYDEEVDEKDEEGIMIITDITVGEVSSNKEQTKTLNQVIENNEIKQTKTNTGKKRTTNKSTEINNTEARKGNTKLKVSDTKINNQIQNNNVKNNNLNLADSKQPAKSSQKATTKYKAK